MILRDHTGVVLKASSSLVGIKDSNEVISLSLEKLHRFSLSLAMMHRYFKMGSVSCHIVSDTSLFMCKTRVPTMSLACPYCIYAVFVHHRL